VTSYFHDSHAQEGFYFYKLGKIRIGLMERNDRPRLNHHKILPGTIFHVAFNANYVFNKFFSRYTKNPSG